MKYGLVDIGTNTIRGVIYSVTDKTTIAADIVFESEIITDTADNKLSEQGIDKLAQTLKQITIFFEKEDTDRILCFATSAMRDVVNLAEVKMKIKRECNIEIELLSGKEEAECDFLALNYNIKENTGIGVDLGGGSCQIFYFEHGKLIHSKSLPIGVKRLYLNFGKYSQNNYESIKRFIYGNLNNFPKVTCNNLYIMGGTAKALKKLWEKEKGIESGYFESNMLDFLSDLEYNDVKLLNIIGKRVNTIEYGVVVIKLLCEYFNAAKFSVMQCGVRDGYLIKKGVFKDIHI